MTFRSTIFLLALHCSLNSQAEIPFGIPTPLCTQKTSECIQQLEDHGQPTPFVMVTIHGLWGDGTQFAPINDYFFKRGVNLVSVVLPGHGADSANNKATYQDWSDELNKAIEVAKLLGDKILIAGQSTGGLLAVNRSLDRSDDIAGLILFEPALKVKALPKFGACSLGRMIGKGPTRLVGNMLGYAVSKESTPSLNLGCVVAKLSQLLKIKLDQHNFENNKMDLPVYLFANQNDSIVSTEKSLEVINKLYKDVVVTQYDPKKLEKQNLKLISHGYVTHDASFSYVTGGLKGFEDFLNNYLKLDTDIKADPYKAEEIDFNELKQQLHALQKNIYDSFPHSAPDEQLLSTYSELIYLLGQLSGARLPKIITPKVYLYKAADGKVYAEKKSQPAGARDSYDLYLSLIKMHTELYLDINSKNRLGDLRLHQLHEHTFTKRTRGNNYNFLKQVGAGMIKVSDIKSLHLDTNQREYILDAFNNVLTAGLIQKSMGLM
jgi:carboxylesterase